MKGEIIMLKLMHSNVDLYLGNAYDLYAFDLACNDFFKHNYGDSLRLRC